MVVGVFIRRMGEEEIERTKLICDVCRGDLFARCAAPTTDDADMRVWWHTWLARRMRSGLRPGRQCRGNQRKKHPGLRPQKLARTITTTKLREICFCKDVESDTTQNKPRRPENGPTREISCSPRGAWQYQDRIGA